MLRPSLIFLEIAALFLAVVFAFWLTTLAPSYKECTTNQGHNESQDEPANSEQMSGWRIFSVRVSGFLQCEAIFIEENEASIIATETFFIALFTIILGLGTLALWRATDRLVIGADSTAKRQLRAYVFVERPSIKDVVGATQITLSCKFKNFGQTPAYGVECAATAFIEPYPPTKVYALGSIGPGSQLDLGPSASGTIRAYYKGSLSPADILDIRNERKAIYFRGVITYRDTFRENQTTEFMLMRKGAKFDDATDDTLEVCHIGNKAT